MSQVASFLDGRVVIDPDVCNGRPVIAGTRIAVQSVLEYLGAGDAEQDVLEAFPELESGDVRACLQFAGKMMALRCDLLKVA